MSERYRFDRDIYRVGRMAISEMRRTVQQLDDPAPQERHLPRDKQQNTKQHKAHGNDCVTSQTGVFRIPDVMRARDNICDARISI